MVKKFFHAIFVVGGLSLAWGCNAILGIHDLSDGGEPSPGSDGSSDAMLDGSNGHDAEHQRESGSGDTEHQRESGSGDAEPGDVVTSDSGDSGSTASCTQGTQRCADGAHVETCGSNGQWGDVWTCATGTCSGGACSGSTTTGTSCPAAGGTGLNTCGAGGSGGESCCTSLEVPGGTYDRTYTNSGTGPKGEADPATVSGFRLDRYLVTVGRFRQFVTAWSSSGGYYPANGSGIHTHLNGGLGLAQAPNVATGQTYESGWDATDWNNATDIDPTTKNLQCLSGYDTWTATATTNENLPINCVNWWESYAFCIWDGGFLLSEAEWEFVAAGGGGANGQREYPWGSTAPGTANQYAIYGSYYTGNTTHIAPVGHASQGAGYWGQFDLAGELYEWNLDWSGPYTVPCIDCAYLPATPPAVPGGPFRVMRGGDFSSSVSDLLPPIRLANAPTLRIDTFGFRCARTP
jgi:formylglycine-generating enzyme